MSVAKQSRKCIAFTTSRLISILKGTFWIVQFITRFSMIYKSNFPLVNEGILLLYLDDLIIIAPDVEEGIRRLRQVLRVASDYDLDINKGKCQLLHSRIEYLGYIIENGTIHPSPGKIQAVSNFPEPRTLKDVQSFLGLSGYFRKFRILLN